MPSSSSPFRSTRLALQLSCAEGGDKNIQFNIEKVKYDSAAGTELSGEVIDCGADTSRNPLSVAAKALTFTQTLEVTPENAQLKAPFEVGFAGFDPTNTAGAEGTKDAPIAWNAGLDGSSFVTITRD